MSASRSIGAAHGLIPRSSAITAKRIPLVAQTLVKRQNIKIHALHTKRSVIPSLPCTCNFNNRRGYASVAEALPTVEEAEDGKVVPKEPAPASHALKVGCSVNSKGWS